MRTSRDPMLPGSAADRDGNRGGRGGRLATDAPAWAAATRQVADHRPSWPQALPSVASGVATAAGAGVGTTCRASGGVGTLEADPRGVVVASTMR